MSHRKTYIICDENTYQDIIDNIIVNYFSAIYRNINQFKNLDVWVYNVVPPPSLNNTWVDEGYPFLPRDNDKLRQQFVEYFNSKIKEYCTYFKFKYLKYLDKDRFLNKEYSDDHVHIANPIFIKQFMIDNHLI